MKKKLYVEITRFILSNSQLVTGIPRMVIEFASNMIKREEETEIELILLYNPVGTKKYKVVKNELFDRDNYYYDRKSYVSDIIIEIQDMEEKSVFLDMENSWHDMLNRSWLLPELRKQGLKIVLIMHDLIAITHPQYCSTENLLRYPAYIGAHFLNDDFIVSTTEVTKSEIERVLKEIQMPQKEVYVCPVGTDFSAEIEMNDVDDEVIEKVKGKKFLLTVGTIEPRKNHKLLFNAYPQLKEMGLTMVFAGNVGWNISDFISEVEKHEDYGENILMFSKLNDATIKYLYREAYFFVFPTFAEGFGLPPVESVRSGTPVIVSDIPVMHEILGGYADYIDCKSPQQLVDMLSKYISDDSLYVQRKESLLSYKENTWTDFATKLSNIIIENT